MEELRFAVGQLYEEFGHNEVTVALSQILDCLVVEKQREEFEEWKKSKDLNKSQKIVM
ncbi:hypothetical protein [Romboutsia lituseburensis]|uniref:Spo0E like sporulation regulatory protein n=1 Tax=Romboutsia lituseburensis DSM 797 TaxID=1121325 RepID=A0A1G9U2M4_9FIRM|nr:hypothetical protein [Romboutsia lituseburensis]CEH34745.1 Hypothetical protein RLITU_2162 [Romboutsia lituseburensis]SDM53864.1 hypothetical protein SAMN04515677_11454 [Romboutsia lituseburensis DSM 797]